MDLGFLDECSVELRGQVLEYLEGGRTEFTVVPEIKGSDFQKAVLEAMMRIPHGEVRSYGEVAEMAGYPRAARAVGTVCRNNKYPIVIPCHRVVASNGIGGYGYGGKEIKKKLLAMEGVYY